MFIENGCVLIIICSNKENVFHVINQDQKMSFLDYAASGLVSSMKADEFSETCLVSQLVGEVPDLL